MQFKRYTGTIADTMARPMEVNPPNEEGLRQLLITKLGCREFCSINSTPYGGSGLNTITVEGQVVGFTDEQL